jgi:hypothetical protein
MNKVLGLLLLAATSLVAVPAMKADTFDYTLADLNQPLITFTRTLTGVPHSPRPLPQFSSMIGQPGDVLVSWAGRTPMPYTMTMTATLLEFQCDPASGQPNLPGCIWDTADPIIF